MKKLFLTLIFFVSHIAYADVSYQHQDNFQSYSEKEILASLIKGLNYWSACTGQNVVIRPGNSLFLISWVPLAKPSELTYKKKNNQISAFNIKLNNNKKLSLLEVERFISHEMGHILGIPDNMEKDSVMFYNHQTGLIDKEKDNMLCRHALGGIYSWL